ncbi:MAG: chloride channel protein [Myxococcota bacterium]
MVDRRVVGVSALGVLVAIAAALVAQCLTLLIGVITNLAFYGRISTAFVDPAGATPRWWWVLVPVIGGLVVGIMARFGSSAIRGHGIPEVMERVLHGESRIPARLMFLKPLSAAIAIGTGGPFGAEGPIIATGGALGSLVGQSVRVSAEERKVLLASGAAAGMAATFGTPVAAVLLAVELLLFEYRARSLVPVALASVAATAVRAAFVGRAPMFPMPILAEPSASALVAYTIVGVAVGFVAVGVTRTVYAVEDVFARLPLHWMWWPALGAGVVGAIGVLEPRSLGVGYDNIREILAGGLVGRALLALVLLKFVSWVIYLGSGTSGGTLAPLFTFGGGLGGMLGVTAAAWWPDLGVDPRVAALVGMSAMFTGASHALLASVVFAFETTRQPLGLLPLLAGSSAAYLVALLSMRTSIMTEKLARRGSHVGTEYTTDFLATVLVRAAASTDVICLPGPQRLQDARGWVLRGGPGSSHQGFPVVDAQNRLVGVLTRRDLFGAHPEEVQVVSLVHRFPAIVYEDNSLREAADHMVREGVGRLVVVRRDAPRQIVGILTRSDLLEAHAHRLRSHDPGLVQPAPVPSAGGKPCADGDALSHASQEQTS